MHQVHDHNQASNQECEKQESNYSIDTTAQCLSFGGLWNIALHNDSAFLIEFEVIIVIVIFFPWLGLATDPLHLLAMLHFSTGPVKGDFFTNTVKKAFFA